MNLRGAIGAEMWRRLAAALQFCLCILPLLVDVVSQILHMYCEVLLATADAEGGNR